VRGFRKTLIVGKSGWKKSGSHRGRIVRTNEQKWGGDEGNCEKRGNSRVVITGTLLYLRGKLRITKSNKREQTQGKILLRIITKKRSRERALSKNENDGDKLDLEKEGKGTGRGYGESREAGGFNC